MTTTTTPSPERQPAVPKYAIGDHVQYIDHHNRMQSGEVYRIEASWASYMKNGPLIVYTVSHPTYRNNRFHAGEAKIISTPAPQAQPDARAVEALRRMERNPVSFSHAASQLARETLQALSAPAADDGWRDISTAPKDGTDVLVCLSDTVAIAHWSKGLGGSGWLDDSGAGHHDYWNYVGLISPTHWRPLPAPPVALHPAAPTDEVGKS